MKQTVNRRRLAILLPVSALLIISVLAFSTASSTGDEKMGWLGVSLQRLTPALLEAMDLSSETGVLITEVTEDSPAEKAGLAAGDVILQYDDKDIASPRRLSKLVRKTAPGTKVQVVISRKGTEKKLTVEIGELEHSKKKCILKFTGEDDDELLLDDVALNMAIGGTPGLCLKWFGSNLWLGIHPVDLSDQLAEHFGIKEGNGVLINEVVAGSPAEKAGLEAGDVILKLDGERIEDTADLHEIIRDHEEGDATELVILRQGKEKKITATLEKSPQEFDFGDFDITKKVQKLPGKMQRMKLMAPREDMIDIYMDMDEDLKGIDLEALEERLQDLEEELEQLREKLETH